MTYRVFTAPADAALSPPRKVEGAGHEFRRLGDALDWAGALGRNMRAVLMIDEATPAKVSVRTREEAARTIP